MFTAALFTIAKTWKQPVSINRWTDKEDVVHIYTMEYYSSIKKNEIMPFAATWMELEIIILSEVSQKQKDKSHMISFICGIWKIQQASEYNKKEADSQRGRDRGASLERET